MEVTKANLATYLAGLNPSATPYPIEITETVASDWGTSGTSGMVGNIINTSTPSGVYLDLSLTIIPNRQYLQATFYNCTSLTTAPIIPNSVTYMDSTFRACTSLTTAPIIPNSVQYLPSTFYGCTSLTTVPIIPSSVISLSYTFSDCTLLHTIQNFAVDVDNCVMTGTFSYCTALANIYVTTLSESSWHLLHTDTDATGTDYTIYNPDGTVAGSGTVAGTSQVLTLYGKSDELVISANITPTLAEETATSQVQWHKSGLPYDDELMIFNAKNPDTVISNFITVNRAGEEFLGNSATATTAQTATTASNGFTNIRQSTDFTLGTYADGTHVSVANTHETNTITCTLPTGHTMNGQSSFTIIAGKILELELIGSVWIDTNTDYYSTTEQIVGRWIDGKPLYRKVVSLPFVQNVNTSTTVGVANMEVQFIDLSSTYIVGTYGYRQPWDRANMLVNNGALDVTINHIGGVFVASIRYTKTTD
jgi:hypothetical protein